METLNFDFLKEGINAGRFSAVAKNSKTSDEIRPEFIANISMSKMCLNGLASKMLGVESGDYLKAMILTKEQCGGDINKKFYIMVSKTKSDDMMTMASVGKVKGTGRKLFLSYAACYSQFLQATVDAQAINPEKLAELGYAYGVEKKDKNGEAYVKYTASREVHYELVDTGVDYPNENGETLRLFACVNPKVVDRPQGSVEDDEEVADAEESQAPEVVEDAEPAGDDI